MNRAASTSIRTTADPASGSTVGSMAAAEPVGDPGFTGSVTARWALILATILSGLFAGFFVTYQISVIRGLAQVDDVVYVRTFQAINATVRTPTFAVIFFGTVPALALASVLHRRAARTTRALLAAATLLAVVTVVITFAGNVPLNNGLAAVGAELPAGVELTPEIAGRARAEFEGPWNRLNLIRTISAVAGGCCAAMAASSSRRSGRI